MEQQPEDNVEKSPKNDWQAWKNVLMSYFNLIEET